MKIGVAITTHQRPGLLARMLPHWANHLHGVAVLTVIHDEDGDGVARSKNRSIAALMDAGCDHLFLADDDIHPLVNDWWKPYVDSPERALCHCWGKSRFVAEDDAHSVWNWPRGVLLYAERRVIDRVGGMRVEFGRWGGEHAEWSKRIHAAGLTTHPFMDVREAKNGLWHCLDYTRQTPSTIGEAEKRAGAARRKELYDRFRGDDSFVDYR